MLFQTFSNMSFLESLSTFQTEFKITETASRLNSTSREYNLDVKRKKLIIYCDFILNFPKSNIKIIKKPPDTGLAI